MTALSVRGLCKTYPGFTLKNVDLDVEEGTVHGLVGRNGAGKSTTLKSILHLVHPDAGEVTCFGAPYGEREKQIRQQIGYAGGAVAYYEKKKIRDLVSVTRNFYFGWQDEAFRRYAAQFALDEEKRPCQLSAGMKVKLNLALALSHGARLLILDEPTGGLDPLSREELLEILLGLARDGTAILFSTHIVSDLEVCADRITCLQNGAVVACGTPEELTGNWRIAHTKGNWTDAQRRAGRGECFSRQGKTLLIPREAEGLFAPQTVSVPTLEQVIIHLEKEAAV